MKANRFLFMVIFAAAMVAVLAGQGVCGLVLTDTDGGKTFISKGKIKQSPAQKGDEYAIVDLEKGTLTVIQPEQKRAAAGTVDEFCGIMDEMKSNMDQVMEEVRKQMKSQNMPADMPGLPGAPPRVRVENKGKGQPVAGYETEKYQVYANNQLYEELWFTRDDRIISEGGDPGQMARFEACASTMLGPGAVENTPELQKLARTGWLLKAVSYADGEKQTLIQVDSIEKMDIPPAEFNIPEGYKKISLKQMFEAK